MTVSCVHPFDEWDSVERDAATEIISRNAMTDRGLVTKEKPGMRGKEFAQGYSDEVVIVDQQNARLRTGGVRWHVGRGTETG